MPSRRNHLALCALAWSGFFLPVRAQEGLQPAQIQEQAIAQFKSGRYAKAVELYKELLAVQPGDVDTIKDLMWAQWNAGLVSETIKSASAVVGKESDDVTAWSLLGRAYMASGQSRKAIGAFENVLRLSPHNVEALMAISRLYVDNKDFRKAEDFLARLEIEESTRQRTNPKLANAWKFIAKGYLANKDYDNAARTFKKVLQLSPEDIQGRVAMSRLLLDLRKYQEAATILESISVAPEYQKQILPKLAHAEFLSGDFATAAANWEKALPLSPENATYKYQTAEALYYNGDYEKALSLFRELLNDPGLGRRSLDFLAHDAISRKDYAGAATLFEENLEELQPEDEARLDKLVDVYVNSRQFHKALRVLNRWSAYNPGNGRILLQRGSIYDELGHFRSAAHSYEKVLKLNPYSTIALFKLYEIYMEMGRVKKALDLLKTFRARDPRNPDLFLLEANAIYTRGDHRAAKELLFEWLRANIDPILTVLLYHGLTPFDRDPLLAYSVHNTVAAFERHMKALAEAGFSPVTAEEVDAWYKGQIELPIHPLLITFDDGRLDSFVHADPVLKKYHQKATAFVIIQNVEKNLASYVNWNDLKTYRETGRWEVQAHGDLSHSYIPIDKEGHKGLFLFNKMWLENPGRLEFTDEWKQRIVSDFKRNKQKIESELGKAPVVFAFPEGNYGQVDVPNFPEAANLTLKLAREEFTSCFVQDYYGMNTRTRDPFLLTRLEPSKTWSGADLLRHISDKNPFARMEGTLLRWALWDGRTQEAYHWLDELKAKGASPSLLAREEARIRVFQGDLASARRLMGGIPGGLAISQEPSAPKENVLSRGRPAIFANGEYFEDDNRRRNWVAAPGVDLGYFGNLSISGFYRRGSFSDHDKEITENGGELDLRHIVGRKHTLELGGAVHSFSDGAKNNSSLSVGLESHWTDNFGMAINVERKPLFWQRAIAAHISQNGAQASVNWRPDGPWKAKCDLHGAHYSDRNDRFTGTWEISRTIGRFPVDLLYRFFIDNTLERSALYYSPDHLVENKLGFNWKLMAGSLGELNIQYLPGYGKERGADGAFVHTAEVVLKKSWRDKDSFSIHFGWNKTPTYESNSANVSLSHRF